MGYIAAALSRRGNDVSELVHAMLTASSSLESDRYGVASPEAVETHSRLLASPQLNGPVLLACKNAGINASPPQPLTQPSGAMGFEGFIYDTEEPDTLNVANILGSSLSNGMRRLVSEVDGAFSAVAIENNRILCARDPVGTVLLYYGVNEDAYAVASNRKMLLAIGLEPKPVQPGRVMELSDEGVIAVKTKTIAPLTYTEEPEEKIIENLHRLLSNVSEKITRKVRGGAVAFSGGIDSTLVAHYLSEAGASVDLICVGVGDQQEYREAQKAADALNLNLQICPFTEAELGENLDTIILSVEDPNPMQIGVAAPLYYASLQAAEQGHQIIFSGNGSDELFGGYQKYLRQWLEEGEKARETMNRDVAESWRNNYERDSKVCNDLGLTLILPFTHPKIIDYGLRIPTHLKLPDSLGKPRKIILRKLAKKLGIPAEISDRPKKAAQYSTGAQKALQRISKRNGMRVEEFLRRRYTELFSHGAES
ncbi:asparagine synthetase B [Candidatus Bathyarchaeota archaeon]|nr:asparagine synthetase B [Candidatus Bathyarchaeota archaeon]